jgi:hypothetical protein
VLLHQDCPIQKRIQLEDHRCCRWKERLDKLFDQVIRFGFDLIKRTGQQRVSVSPSKYHAGPVLTVVVIIRASAKKHAFVHEEKKRAKTKKLT